MRQQETESVTKKQQGTKIATCPRPHVDELIGIWLLKKFGATRFLHIDQARVVFSQHACSDDDTICIGVGGGLFDAHDKPAASSSALIAGHLGLSRHESISRIIRHANVNNNQGAKSFLELGNLVKAYHRFPQKQDEMVDFVCSVLDYKQKAEELGVSYQPQKTRAGIDTLFDTQRKVRQSKKEQRVVKAVRLPNHFLLADAIAYVIAYNFGVELFPGIQEAPLVFGNEKTPVKDEHVLEIGCGDGLFSVHSAHAVAEYCGTIKKGECVRLLREVLIEYKGGTVHSFDLRGLLRDHETVSPEKPEERLQWIAPIITVVMMQQRNFHNCCDYVAKQRKRGKLRETTVRHDGRTRRIVAIRSDNEEMGKAVRKVTSADIVIQQNSKRNVCIFTDSHIESTDMAALWRAQEQKKRGKLKEKNWKRLRKEGSMFGIYLMPNTHFVLCGSESHPHNTSVLSLDELFHLAQIAYDDGFHSKFSDSCTQGICAGNACPWYKFGLNRCRKIRYHQKRNGVKRKRTN